MAVLASKASTSPAAAAHIRLRVEPSQGPRTLALSCQVGHVLFAEFDEGQVFLLGLYHHVELLDPQTLNRIEKWLDKLPLHVVGVGSRLVRCLGAGEVDFGGTVVPGGEGLLQKFVEGLAMLSTSGDGNRTPPVRRHGGRGPRLGWQRTRSSFSRTMRRRAQSPRAAKFASAWRNARSGLLYAPPTWMTIFAVSSRPMASNRCSWYAMYRSSHWRTSGLGVLRTHTSGRWELAEGMLSD